MRKTVYQTASPSIKTLPGETAKPAQCVLVQHGESAVLFIDAPNWANALSVGPTIALEAWMTHLRELEGLPEPDGHNLKFVLVRPGFPKKAPLWLEGFSQYLPCARNAPWLYSMTPVAGTGDMTLGNPFAL